jgi:predicted SnoaL-like aldol condensation-catalyzing enzyme
MSASGSNKQLVRHYIEALGARDFDRAAEMSEPAWIQHVPDGGSSGLEQLRPGAEVFFAAFSDWRPSIEEQIGEVTPLDGS